MAGIYTLPFCYLRSPALARLVHRIASEDYSFRVVVWSTCRYICRALQNPFDPFSIAQELATQVMAGAPYAAITLGLRVAHQRTVSLLRSAGALARVARPILEQSLHVIRAHFRANLGLRSGFEVVSWESGQWVALQSWDAFADGSLLQGHAGLGARWRAVDQESWNSLSQPLPNASNALEAEILAAAMALNALADLGARHVHLRIDCNDALCAMQGRLAPKYCLLEAQLQYALARFEGVKVSLVPRMFNYAADRLAAEAAQRKQS